MLVDQKLCVIRFPDDGIRTIPKYKRIFNQFIMRNNCYEGAFKKNENGLESIQQMVFQHCQDLLDGYSNLWSLDWFQKLVLS